MPECELLLAIACINIFFLTFSCYAILSGAAQFSIRITFCVPQEVGWRDDSLRMVMVLTDAGFKTALDGKVAMFH